MNKFEQAVASLQRGQLTSAQLICEEILRSEPQHIDALHLSGLIAMQMGNPRRAAELIGRSTLLDPRNPAAFFNRGAAQQTFHALDAALASYERAIAIAPDYEDAHCNKALLLLLAGEMEKGWSGYEWRWARERAVSHWLGREPIAGKTILLYGEQGLGDTIQFCRYVPLVADRGARVKLRVQRPLINLLCGLRGVAQLIADGDPIPEFDHSCPLMSLPAAFGTTLDSIPARVPYLRSPAGKVAHWRERLGNNFKPRIGLVWSGGFRPDRPEKWTVNRRRNIPLAKLAPLKTSAVEYYSLQKGQPAESELAEMTARSDWAGPHIIDHTAELADFTDTAALIENLDLIISVDTSTAHLAGAWVNPYGS